MSGRRRYGDRDRPGERVLPADLRASINNVSNFGQKRREFFYIFYQTPKNKG